MSRPRLQMEAQEGNPLSPVGARTVIVLLARVRLRRWCRENGKQLPHTHKWLEPASAPLGE